MFADNPPYRWRTQRVFISSTFRDFHAERDYLVKFVFPELREWCAPFKIHLVDVDLRWGISEAQARSGRVLELCLEQVDECRPFFLALIGNRYGSIPNEGSTETVRQQFPGLAAATGMSVTHLEIHHAIFDPPRSLHADQAEPRSFFYFRDEAALPPPETFTSWTDTQRNEYVETFFDPHGSAANTSLLALKSQIEAYVARRPDDRAACGIYRPVFDPSLPNPEDPRLRGRFSAGSLDAFGTQVRRQLTLAIGEQFADRIRFLASKRDDPRLRAENERDLQESFVTERLDKRIHVGRPELIASLRAYLNGGSRKILGVTGQPGSGKSTLLAELFGEIQSPTELPGAPFVIPHFVGASPGSTSLPSVLLSLCQLLKGRFTLSYDVPTDPLKLPWAFLEVLDKCTGKMVIILDGLNQLDDFGDAHQLQWLPAELPPNVKIIASTLPGKTADALSAKTSQWVTVGDLSLHERANVVEKVPSVFAKTLEPRQIHALLAKKETGNPLYLKVAIEELRLFGGFGELLEDKINNLPPTLDGMFAFLLERLEDDHCDAPRIALDEKAEDLRGVVESVFCLLACSRNGLTEPELASLLPEDTERHHQVILRQVRDCLQRSGDVVTFFHTALSKAVRARWMESRDTKVWHTKLANVFQNQPTLLAHRMPNMRKAIELARQETLAERWDGLRLILTDLDWIEAKVRADMVIDLQQDFDVGLAALPEGGERAESERLLAIRGFLRGHAQRLTAYHDFLSTYAHHLSRTYAPDLSRLPVRWPWPYLGTQRLASRVPVANPPRERPPLPLIKTVEVAFGGMSAAVALASKAKRAFYSKKLGVIHCIATESPRELGLVRVQPKRPVSLQVSADATYMAIAYEHGDADILQLSYDEQGNVARHMTVAEISYRVPVAERPILRFIGSALFYQSSSGEIVSHDVRTGQESQAGEWPAEAVELSCVLQAQEKVVFAFRHEAHTELCVVSLPTMRILARGSLGAADVSAGCDGGGPDYVYLARSNGAIMGIDVRGGISVAHERRVGEAAETLLCFDNTLLWTSDGSLFRGSADLTANDPIECVATDRVLLRSMSVARGDDGEISVASASALTCYKAGTGIGFGAPEICEVFARGTDGYVALARDASHLSLIDQTTGVTVPLVRDADRDYVADVDGCDNLLIVGKSGAGAWCNLQRLAANAVPRLPTNTLAIAGRPSGGFWVADGRRLYRLDIENGPRVFDVMKLPWANPSRLWMCCDGACLTLCCLEALAESPSYEILFIDTPTRGGGEPRRRGSRVFFMHELEINSMAWNPSREQLYLVGRSEKGCTIKTGTPTQFSDGCEDTHIVDGLDMIMDRSALDPNCSSLWLLSRQGTLFRVRTDDFTVEATLSSLEHVTAIVEKPGTTGRTAFVTGRRSVFAAELRGAKRGEPS